MSLYHNISMLPLSMYEWISNTQPLTQKSFKTPESTKVFYLLNLKIQLVLRNNVRYTNTKESTLEFLCI